jgi:hypothetical protein
MVSSRARVSRKGSRAASMRVESLAMSTSRASRRSRCIRHKNAWCCPNRPTSAWVSGVILVGIRPLAIWARTWGSRSPAISASSIARPDTPRMSVATELIFMPGVFQLFFEPGGFAGVFAGQRGPVAGQVPQLADRCWGHERRLQQPALAQLRQPHRVADVGLAARQPLRVGRVDQDDVQVVFEHIERWTLWRRLLPSRSGSRPDPSTGRP